jgi:hypothetical protein
MALRSVFPVRYDKRAVPTLGYCVVRPGPGGVVDGSSDGGRTTINKGGRVVTPKLGTNESETKVTALC